MLTIRTDDLLLRTYTDADAAALADAVRESTATVGRWMAWCHAGFSEQDALAWFAVCREALKAESAYEFGIFSAASGELLGGAGLNLVNKLHASCNLGYWIRQTRQHQRVAPRCARALAGFGFTGLAFKRIEIVVAEGNFPSMAVARAIGAQFECVARNRLIVHGQSVPASVFSLVPEDLQQDRLA